jgi:dolichyl-phosphate-mannose--protein O-mannosyl transferase
MKKWLVIGIILAFAFLLRFWQLGLAPKLYFDEIHYVYDALKYQSGLLAVERGSAAVPKHPLLSTAFIQLGLRFFGMNPLGWRFFSALFGTASIFFFFLLAEKLFSYRTAVIAAFLLSIDFLHLVLSRAALVEIYVFFFIIAGFYFLACCLKHDDSRGILLAGTFFGLSLATKWSAALSVISSLVIYLILAKDKSRLKNGFVYLILFPFALFILISLFLNLSAGMTVPSWIKFEINNFLSFQRLAHSHPHYAPAWTWPLVLKPTPLYGNNLDTAFPQLIIAMGNPLVYWLIIPVFLFLIYDHYKTKDPSLLFILIGFFGFYLPWLFYPTRAGFFFYYFLPTVPFYLLGLSHVLDRLMSSKPGKCLAYLYLAAVLAAFLLYSPLLYGFPASVKYLKAITWFKLPI